MKVLALAVLVAAALAASAPVAAAPDGFRDSIRLQPIANDLSPGASVYCSRGEAQWKAEVTVRFPTAPTWSRVGAYYETGGGLPPEVFLSPWACRSLEGWLRGKNTPTLQYLAVYALALVHELMHTNGISGEREAECAALKRLPAVLRDHLRVRKPATLKAVMRLAWADNRSSPAAYQGC